MAESFSREKLRHAPQKEGGGEILCDPPSCVTLAGTSIDVQNEWEENTHTHSSKFELFLLWDPLFNFEITRDDSTIYKTDRS